VRLFQFLSRLPWPVLYALAHAIDLLSYHVLRYRRPVVDANLLLAFPDKTAQERREIARQFYRNLSQIIVEIIKFLTISEADFQRRVQIVNHDVLLGHLAAGRPVIVMAGHFGNWEITPLISRLYASGCPMLPVYKTLSSPFFDRLMLAIRSRFGCEPIVKEATLRRLVKFRQAGQPFCLGLVADQSPAGHEIDCWVDFFGRPTPFYTGGDKLAKTTGFPVLYSYVRRVKKGHYQLVYEELKAPPYRSDSPEVIELFAARLEQSIRESPADWLWSHKRWKHQKPAAFTKT
jgi:Kdo2-lipid IVA lauroyltransferase/acyltransferase